MWQGWGLHSGDEVLSNEAFDASVSLRRHVSPFETLRPDALSEAIISAHFSCRRGSGQTGLQSDVP